MTGSSPLTRGKHGSVAWDASQQGLIPAHAGKTHRCPADARTLAAHPRSRGENIGEIETLVHELGSSPLTRGKRGPRGWPAGRARLIPAHAGKTGAKIAGHFRYPAHPRSRGENLAWAVDGARGYGSSPLTRGKRVRCRER